MQIINNLSKQPVLCVILCMILFFAVYGANYMLLAALLKMHRSKSAVKKLNQQYSFGKKLWFIHFYDNCLHAVGFCKFFVWYSRVLVLFFGICLLSALLCAFQLLSSDVIAWMCAVMLFIFVLPTGFIMKSVSRPIIGRFKYHTFEKYHNTDNHTSLY